MVTSTTCVCINCTAYVFMHQNQQVAKKARSTFWQKFWNDYCEKTHFHGFHELRSYHDWFNKIFWISVIVLGFVFSFCLIYIGVRNYLEDQVDTHVTTLSQGAIDLPVLYCPKRWIDHNRVAKGTEKYLLYALSYLRIHNYVYIPYENMVPFRLDSFSFPDKPNSPNYYDEPSSLYKMAAFQVAAYLSEKTPPAYYIGISRLYMSSIPSLVWLFQYQTRFFDEIYPIYLENRSNDLFEYVYYNLTLSYTMVYMARHTNEGDSSFVGTLLTHGFRYNPKFNTRGNPNKNLSSMVDDRFKLKYTLNSLDRNETVEKSFYTQSLNNESNFVWPTHFKKHNILIRSELKSYSSHNETYWSNTVKKQQMYLKMFHGSSFTKLCDSIHEIYCTPRYSQYPEEKFAELKIRMALEQERSSRMIKLIRGDSKIVSNFNSNDEEAIKDYLEKCCGDNEKKFDDEVKRLVSNAEHQFMIEEKLEFENFLKSNSHDSVLSYLKNVSFDESDFIVSFSMDPKKHIRPNKSNITAKRIVMADGTCILFQIKLDENSLGGSADEKIEEDSDNLYPGHQSYSDTYSTSPIKTAYVNIVAIQNFSLLFAERESNMVTFGESAYVSSQEFFDAVKFPVKQSYFQKINTPYNELTVKYDQFVIESLRNVDSIARSASHCQQRNLDSQDDDGELPYTYSECLLSCANFHSNPKIACYLSQNETEGKICRELTSCSFIAESRNFPKDMETCSFFNMHQIYENWTPMMRDYDSVNSEKKLECSEKCFPPCQSLKFQVKNTVVKEDFTGLRLRYMNTSKVLNLTQSQNRLTWMPKSLLHDITYYLFHINKYGKNVTQYRMEIQISATVITYKEQLSFTWDAIFGVVGGQIGLVMGASCLTFIQFFWLLTVTLYRHFSDVLLVKKPVLRLNPSKWSSK